MISTTPNVEPEIPGVINEFVTSKLKKKGWSHLGDTASINEDAIFKKEVISTECSRVKI